MANLTKSLPLFDYATDRKTTNKSLLRGIFAKT